MNLNDTQFLVGHSAARRRHDPGARASQSAGGVGPQPARRGARAGARGGCGRPRVRSCGAGALRRGAARWRCRGAAPAAGDAKKDEGKKEAAPAKKEGGKK